MKGKRFGVLRKAMGWDPHVDAAMEAAIAKIKAAGGEVVDVEVKDYDKWNDAEFQVLMYEFKDGLNTYLKNAGATQGSLEALIAWDKAHAADAM